MKKWPCYFCSKEVSVGDVYKEEYCCDGRMCGCYGAPLNPVICNDCSKTGKRGFSPWHDEEREIVEEKTHG